MENQMNVPELRFPGFTGEWEKKKLGEVAEVNPINKKLPSRFIYIDLESVIRGELMKEQTIKLIHAPSRAQRLLQKNDVLFQMVRPYQKNNFFFDREGDFVASTGYAQLRTQQSARYLYQYLHFQKFVDKVIERCTGTSYPAINSTDLSNIELFLPSFPEQQKIASFLTAADGKIQSLQKQKSLLEQYKKGIMQKLFSRELRFKDENGEDFPDWEVKKLGDMADIFDGTHQTPKYVSSGVRFVSVENIDDLKGTNKFITQEAFEKEYKVKPRTGDILMTRIGVIGERAIVQNDEPLAYYVSLSLLRVKDNTDFTFLAQRIETSEFKRELHKRTIHVAFPKKINLGDIQNCEVGLPTLPEQIKIASFLSSVDEKIELVSKQLEKTQQYKKGLLQQMFI